MKRLISVLGMFLVCIAIGVMPAAAAERNGDNVWVDRTVAGKDLDASAYAVVADSQLLPEELKNFLGEASLPAIIAQPDLPMELRPTGIPVVRPGHLPEKTMSANEPLLSGPLPDPIVKKEQQSLPRLLPEPQSEPDIVYIVPFTRVMVPDEVYEGLFDEFVDAMNRQADILGLHFVILKEGIQRVGLEWLAARKYITGEIYAYVEDSVAYSTEISTKAHISYYHPKQKTAAFDTVLPISVLFENDCSDLGVERIKLAEDMATTLTDRLLPSFDKLLIGTQSHKTHNNGA